MYDRLRVANVDIYIWIINEYLFVLIGMNGVT